MVEFDEKVLSDIRRRFRSLYDESVTWRAHWAELRDYIAPNRGAFLDSIREEKPSEKGAKKRSKIINNVAEKALQILTSGLHGGLTSPSRPWFRFGLEDKDLEEFTQVRLWLRTVRDLVLDTMARTNFYSSIHMVYKETGGFGTGNMFILEDHVNYFRCKTMTVGEYYLTTTENDEPDTVFRLLSLTASQLVAKFGEENVSEEVKRAAERQPDKWFTIVHMVRPRSRYDPFLEDNQAYPYESVYFEYATGEQNKVLSVSGFKSKPFVSPRWEVTGSEIFGRGPGMVALPDVKALQRIESDKLMAIAKMANPPMKAGPNLKPAAGNVKPGGVTFVDEVGGMDSYAPVYQVNPNVNGLLLQVDKTERAIREAFYNELFLAILQEEKTMTAREVAERHDEKLLQLGPTLERLERELLSPTIERVLDILFDAGMVPPPPPELEGMDIRIEYISILAQAQKLVSLGGIERLVGFTGGLAQLDPSVIDILNLDKSIEDYARTVGVDPSLIRDPQEVAAIRAERARQQQAAQMAMAAQAAKPAAEAAKDLSETETSQGNALDNLLGFSGPGTRG